MPIISKTIPYNCIIPRVQATATNWALRPSSLSYQQHPYPKEDTLALIQTITLISLPNLQTSKFQRPHIHPPYPLPCTPQPTPKHSKHAKNTLLRTFHLPHNINPSPHSPVCPRNRDTAHGIHMGQITTCGRSQCFNVDPGSARIYRAWYRVPCFKGRDGG